MIRTIRARRALGDRAGPRGRRSLRFVLFLGVMLVALLGPHAAAAAPPSTTAPGADEAEPEPDAEAEPEAAPDSPRASMRTFIELCRAGDYEGAAGFLELPQAGAAEGAELARRLEAVIDRRLPLELATLSPASTGMRNDGLPRNVDEIGTIELDDGTTEPVTLVKRFRPEPRWVFSKATVARIDTWYAQLENYWLLANLPPVLLTPGPRGVPWWQWIALPLLVAAATVAGWLLARAGRLVISRFVRKLDRPLLAQISRPFVVIWTLAILYTTLPFLGVHSRVEGFVYGALRTSFLVVVFWVLVSLLDLACSLILRSSWAITHPSGSALVPLARRITKVALVAIVVVAVFADLGYPVASMLAGLGIGGLVVALAAQKTVENLFGAFAIGADQPFREGDYVRVEGFEGTVEAIGLRSTRFRTLDRTLVTVPNGKLADMRIETLTARDRMRMTCIVGLVYGTTAEQLRAVLQGFEDVLRAHPKIWDQTVIVRLKAFGASSLDVEVMAWFQTTDPIEQGRNTQEVLMGFMEVVQAAGTALAFPTQTIHLETAGDPRPAASAPA